MRFYFPKPTCTGRDCYVDNRTVIALQKYRSRTLFPGERYCIHGSKARKFKKSDAKYYTPGWCPKLHRSIVIRIYARMPMDAFYYLHYGEDWEPPIYLCRHILRVTTTTPYTPGQFYKELTSGFCDFMDMLGHYPDKHDVIAIDNGLNAAYLHLDGKYNWVQLHRFDKSRCDDGSIGGYAVIPHEEKHRNHFAHTTEEYMSRCIGYMHGYFADERFQSHWQDNRYELAEPDMWKEFEALVDALKADGFLRSREEMRSYCFKFPQGRFESNPQEYGYTVETKSHRFCIHCLPDDESYNVYLYVYLKMMKER